jgi:chromosome segregation ATPase
MADDPLQQVRKQLEDFNKWARSRTQALSLSAHGSKTVAMSTETKAALDDVVEFMGRTVATIENIVDSAESLDETVSRSRQYIEAAAEHMKDSDERGGREQAVGELQKASARIESVAESAKILGESLLQCQQATARFEQKRRKTLEEIQEAASQGLLFDEAVKELAEKAEQSLRSLGKATDAIGAYGAVQQPEMVVELLKRAWERTEDLTRVIKALLDSLPYVRAAIEHTKSFLPKGAAIGTAARATFLDTESPISLTQFEAAGKLKQPPESVRAALDEMRADFGAQIARLSEQMQAMAAGVRQALQPIQTDAAARPAAAMERRPNLGENRAAPETGNPMEGARQVADMYARMTTGLLQPGPLKFEATGLPRAVQLAWALDMTFLSPSTLDQFVLARCEGPNCTNFTNTTALAPDKTTYVDENLEGGKTYRYKLTAFLVDPHHEFTLIADAITRP